MTQEIETMIGDGVTIRGSESLIREVMEVPDDVIDVPSFLRSLATGVREDLTIDTVDALFGWSTLSPCEQKENVADAVVELACRLKKVEDDLSFCEAETKPDLEPWDDKCRRWKTDSDGRVHSDERLVHRESRFAPGTRVWDVGTGAGPWVLIRTGNLNIPVELPPESAACAAQRGGYTDPNYIFPVFREVKINAWVVETAPWTFKMIPEACLEPEGGDINLTDRGLEILEKEAADEAESDLIEMYNRGWGCADEAMHAQTEEIKNLRKHTTRTIYAASAALSVVLGSLFWWLTQNIG